MTARVFIRPLESADQHEFLERECTSRKLHRPWTTAPSTPPQFASFVERMQAPANYCFLVCNGDRANGSIVGVVNVTNIVLGPFCSGYLGYYAFAGFERKGFMHAGLASVVRHVFKSFELHRLEANIQPGNLASIALVRSCGFCREGYSPRYLKIGGRWRDHERWAIVAS